MQPATNDPQTHPQTHPQTPPGANPYMMMPGMYGVNFIEHLFKHILEHGFEGAWVLIMAYYMYVSQDAIKNLFKYLNDKVAESTKMYVELYVPKIKNGLTKLVTDCGKRLIDYVKEKIFKKKEVLKEEGQVKPPNPPPPPDLRNKLTVYLSLDNKIDLMSFGNFLMETRKHHNINEYTRLKSDKYKTTEHYQIPTTIQIQQSQFPSEYVNSQYQNFSIEIKQNVGITIISESDGKNEMIRDIQHKPVEGIQEVSHKELHTQHLDKMPFPWTSLPNFKWSESGNYYDPENFCQGYFIPITAYIYYTKNIVLFTKFYNFLRSRGTFDFNGKKWKLQPVSLCPKELDDPVLMDRLLKDLEKYWDTKFIPFFKGVPTSVEKWIADHKSKFDEVILHKSHVSITFISNDIPTFQLETISRLFVNNMIRSYYKQHIESVGNKISIYQLSIKYDTKIVKKDNPKYKEWEEKYGKEEEENKKKEEERKKEEEKKKAEEEKKKTEEEKKKEGEKKKEEEKKPEVKEVKEESFKPDYGPTGPMYSGYSSYSDYGDDHSYSSYDMPYDNYRYGRGKYNNYSYNKSRIPRKPEQFIDEIIHVPHADCAHI